MRPAFAVLRPALCAVLFALCALHQDKLPPRQSHFRFRTNKLTSSRYSTFDYHAGTKPAFIYESSRFRHISTAAEDLTP